MIDGVFAASDQRQASSCGLQLSGPVDFYGEWVEVFVDEAGGLASGDGRGASQSVGELFSFYFFQEREEFFAGECGV